MKIEVTNLQSALTVTARAVRRVARAALGDRLGCYSIVLVDDATMKDLNRRYLGRDGTTDVIAFPFEDAPLSSDDCAGEVIVSGDVAAAEARRRNIDPLAELSLYIVHGLLHLTGHDDTTPDHAAAMHARERHILAELGLDPAQLWKPLVSSLRRKKP